MIPLKEVENQLPELFRRRGVVLAYLFGSHAEGHVHGESDIDFAVLLPGEPEFTQRYRTQMDLMGDLMDLLRFEDVDVVILNEAPPLLRMEVLRRGHVLMCDDDNVRIAFEARTLREYWDTRSIRASVNVAMNQRLRIGMWGRPIPYRRLFEAEKTGDA